MLDLKLAGIALLVLVLCLIAGPKIGGRVAAAGRRRGWHSQRAHAAGKYADALTWLIGALVVSVMVVVRFR